jgi:hypothetical protein
MLKDPTYHIGLLKTYMYENSNFEKKWFELNNIRLKEFLK